MKDYVEIMYNKGRQQTNYPLKFGKYLFDRFGFEKGQKFLEIGCGNGDFLRVFKEIGLDCKGVDISEYSVNTLKELDVKKFVAITAHVSRKNVVRVLEEVKILANETIEKKTSQFGYDNAEDLADFYTKLLLSAGHASHAEHSLGAALGACDMKKVEIMNALLEKNFEKALKKWPAI